VRSSSNSQPTPAKDLNFNLDISDLAKVQRLDAYRSSKLNVSAELQQTGKMNSQKNWKRSMAEYMDSRFPGEVMEYQDSFAVRGMPTGKPTKKAKKSYYKRTTERRELPPVEEVKCCVNDCLQQNLPRSLLQELRDEYRKCTTVKEKRDFLRDYLDAETKRFSTHGQHLTWEAMYNLFGSSKTMIQTVKRTPCAEHSGEAYRNQGIRGHHVMQSKEEIITAFLKCVSSEFEAAPNCS
jgi:hypothetical protein